MLFGLIEKNLNLVIFIEGYLYALIFKNWYGTDILVLKKISEIFTWALIKNMTSFKKNKL